jgi:hypothetical protein
MDEPFFTELQKAGRRIRGIQGFGEYTKRRIFIHR